MDLPDKFKEACVKNGIMLFDPAGHLVKAKAGSLKLQWGDEGLFVSGLKPGFELADFAGIKKFKAEQAKAKAAKEAKEKPAPKPEAKPRLRR